MTPPDQIPGSVSSVRVALVHDYLTQRGGAERVVLAMSDAFPSSPIYTSLYDPEATYAGYGDRDVRTSPINRIRLLRQRHRLALPVLAPVFSALRVPADVVLCSSSGWAHGVRTEGRKVVYCHSPAKWLHASDRYFSGTRSASRALAAGLRGPLLRWDRAAAASADHYVVNSRMVQRWVREVYDRDAEVVPPPRGLDPDGPDEPVAGLSPGFLLCVSRLLAYKNVESVVTAVAGLPDQQLVVVGAGPLEAELQKVASSNVVFAGRVDDAGLRWLYRQCSAVVAAALEDFGLTPPEAAAFGKPVAVLRWGGFLDTVVEGVTGLFFDVATPEAVRATLRQLAAQSWDEDAITSHGRRYAPERFTAEMRRVIFQQAARAA